jgi:hypothetical protein
VCETPEAVAARKKFENDLKIGATVGLGLLMVFGVAQIIRDFGQGRRR